MESCSTEGIRRIAQNDLQIFHAASIFDVLELSFKFFARFVVPFAEPADGLSAGYVPGPSARVALSDPRQKMLSEVNRGVPVLTGQKVSEIFHDYVRIVVCLHEPIEIFQIVREYLVEGGVGLLWKIFASVFDVDDEGWHRGVVLSCYEQQLGASSSPSSAHVYCFSPVIFREGHHEAENSNIVKETVRY